MPHNKTLSHKTKLDFLSRHWPFMVMLLATSYVAAQIFADIASIKIGTFALFGQTVVMDMGTLIYPITFTLRDLVHKRLGKKNARNLVLIAAIVNIFMALYFQACTWFAYDASTPQAPWDDVLGPIWRIVIASIVAEVVSELVDGEVYERWTAIIGDRWQWTRVLFSNAVSVPLDSAVFVALAFAGDMPIGVLISIFAANVIVKMAMTLASLGMIYLV